MSKPICEVDMVSRPSPHLDGWLQWGTTEKPDMWGLEDSLNQAESFYYLHAAGVCEIRGKDQLGQPKPLEDREIAVADAGQAVVAVQSTPAESQLPAWATLPAWQYGALIGLAVFGLVIWSRVQAKQTKATDETPAPTYSDDLYGGQ